MFAVRFKMVFKCVINENVLRLILLAFNYLLTTLSLALIALGIFLMNDNWWPRKYAGSNFSYIPVLLTILGALSFLTSISGCYFIRIQNNRLLRINIIFLIVLLGFELTLAVISFLNVDKDARNEVRKKMKYDFLNSTLENNFTDIEDHVSVD